MQNDPREAGADRSSPGARRIAAGANKGIGQRRHERRLVWWGLIALWVVMITAWSLL